MYDRGLTPIIYLGTCFFVLFSGYSVFKGLLPNLRNDKGPLFVALNYFWYAIGSLLTPEFVSMNLRLCFIIAGVSYPLFILSIKTHDTVVIIASMYNGFSSGLLWAAQGCWMATICSIWPQNSAKYNGIFMGLYGIGGVIGNICIATLLYLEINTDFMVWILGIVSIIGISMLIFIPSMWLYVENNVGEVHLAVKFSSVGSRRFSVVDSVDSVDSTDNTDTDMYTGMPADDTLSESTISYNELEFMSAYSEQSSSVYSDNQSDDTDDITIIANMPSDMSDIVVADDAPVKYGRCDDCIYMFVRRYRSAKSLFTESRFPIMILPILSMSIISVYIWVLIPKIAPDAFSTAVMFAVFNFFYGLCSKFAAHFIKKMGIVGAYLCTAMLSMFVYTYIYVIVWFRPLTSAFIGMIVCAVVAGIAIGIITVLLFTVYSTEYKSREHSMEAYTMNNAFYCLFYALSSLILTSTYTFTYATILFGCILAILFGSICCIVAR